MSTSNAASLATSEPTETGGASPNNNVAFSFATSKIIRFTIAAGIIVLAISAVFAFFKVGPCSSSDESSLTHLLTLTSRLTARELTMVDWQNRPEPTAETATKSNSETGHQRGRDDTVRGGRLGDDTGACARGTGGGSEQGSGQEAEKAEGEGCEGHEAKRGECVHGG